MNLALNQSTQVITPNQRLSKYLLRRHKQQVLKTTTVNRSFYQKKISSLDAWLRTEFKSLQEQYPFQYGALQLISSEQEKLLWQELVLSSDISKKLLLQKNCVQDVMQAHSLCQDWQINKNFIKSSHHYMSIDQTCFLEWQENFESLCVKQNLITSSNLLRLISKAIEQEQLVLNDEYLFYGFDELSPSQQTLQEKLSDAGKIVVNSELPKETAPYQRLLKCADFKDEITFSAEWSKSISENDSSANIAIVIPSLAENRQDILNTFLKTLHPDTFLSGSNIYPLPFNISSGIPLSDVPLVKAALFCISFHKLQIFNEKISSVNLSETIRNPFIFHGTISKKNRLAIDKEINSRKQLELTTLELTEIINKFTNEVDFIQLISKALSGNLSNTAEKSHSEWRSVFLAQLESFFWLKGKPLDSESFQASKKFIEVLGNFASLDDCLSPCTFKQAISRLEELLRANLFQADSISENINNIHILGSLEAAGQDFTHLWLCEMHDKTWPSKARPNPFLPSGLQKELNMPHSSAQRELEFCQQITRRFQQHCSNIIFSYGDFDQDEQINPSPLLQNIVVIEKNQLIEDFQLQLSAPLLTRIFKQQRIEFFDDNKNIPIALSEILKGGQNIIKFQAQCPFSAFAAHRLAIKSFEDINEGVSALDRGNIVHLLMEYFWREVKKQEALLSMNESEIIKLLEKHSKKIESELNINFSNHKVALSIELKRAQEAALMFLNTEKQRSNFEVIAFEKKQEQEIKGLYLSLRVDRIDKLEDGSELIIDYKSSPSHPSSWLSPRIDEPQLPIYLMINPKAESIAFGVINKNNQELGLTGIASDDKSIAGIINCQDEKKNKKFSNNWPDILNEWKSDIELQAKNFMAGINFVDPKNINSSCAYCDFSSICRINEIDHRHDDDWVPEE